LTQEFIPQFANQSRLKFDAMPKKFVAWNC